MEVTMKRYAAAIAPVLLGLFFLPTAVGQPQAKSFVVNLENFQILRTRARHNDTVHVSFTLKVGDKTYGPLVKHMGDRNDGTHNVGLSIGPIDIPAPDTPVVLNYVIVNAGHKNNAEVEKALRAGSEQLLKEMANRDKGGGKLGDWRAELLKSVVQLGLNLLFANCDGVVAADQIVLTGGVLRKWDNGHKETREYPGTDSPAGCGRNSIYRVTWSVTRK
jgi:hypothetical protein